MRNRNVYAVLGEPNDLSRQLMSLWSSRGKAEAEVVRLNENERTRYDYDVEVWQVNESHGDGDRLT